MDIERLEWEIDGAAALKRCHGDLKKYRQAFVEVRREREQRDAQGRAAVAAHIHNTVAELRGAHRYEQAQKMVVSGLSQYAMSGTTSLHRLAGVLASLRDPSDGKIDTTLAMELLKKLPDDVKAAAGQRIDELAQDSLRNVGVGITIDFDKLRAAVVNIRQQFPALAAAADTGAVSRELLDILFWPKAHVFK